MSPRLSARLLAAGLLAVAAWMSCTPDCPDDGCPKNPEPVKPAPAPAPQPPKTPPRPLVPRPWRELDKAPVGAHVAGNVANDGTELQCDFPGELHRRNTASKGLGNCVFTSIHHSAVWQNVPALLEFPKYLIDKGIPGGGYPSKVESLIARMCKDRGVSVPDYIQVEGTDLEILKAACRAGRMPSVTYSFSPTGRYGGSRISHMVTLCHADDKWFTVCDNNYPGANAFEYCSPQEFLRTYTGGKSGWSVILLAPAPPPAPRNKKP